MSDPREKAFDELHGDLGLAETELRYVALADEELEREIRRLQLKARALAKRGGESEDIELILICLERIEVSLSMTHPESTDGVRVRIRLFPILLYLRSKLARYRRLAGGER